MYKRQVQDEREDPREAGAPRLVLAVALLKSDHLELALEKVVELGAHRFVPLLSERCVVQWKERSAERKLQRLERIAVGAMKQSQRSWRCRVCAPRPLREAVEEARPALLVVGDEVEEGLRCRDLVAPLQGEIWGLVGPEGGFSGEEKAWLAQEGARAVTLSPFRLRSETAAVVLAQRLAELCARPA